MPWTPKSFAKRHNHGLKGKRARQAADVADSVLARTGDEGLAVREANGVAKRMRAPARRAANRKRSWRPGG